jgi:nucleotide-binding universal stress UspA family protein
VILQTVDELDIHLIVMGTHGRRGLSRALLGSVAENIVRASRVPVLTVREPKTNERRRRDEAA